MISPKPYDPTALGPQGDEDPPGTLRDEDGNVLPTFDPKYSKEFVGLLYLGALTDEFEWLGHHFVIRTLRDGEKLAVAQIIKPYQETLGYDRAYAMGMVSMAIVTIDGQELPIPIGETSRINEWAHQRFDHVRNNWFSPTTDAVYNRIVQLDILVEKVVDAMGKASAPQDSPSTSNAM